MANYDASIHNVDLDPETGYPKNMEDVELAGVWVANEDRLPFVVYTAWMVNRNGEPPVKASFCIPPLHIDEFTESETKDFLRFCNRARRERKWMVQTTLDKHLVKINANK